MTYLTLFEGKTLFNKVWPLLDSRAKLDLRLTKLLLLKRGVALVTSLYSWHSVVFIEGT